MNKKLIATDLDGTLVYNEMYLTPYTKEIIKKIVSDGHIFMIASGRPDYRIIPFFQDLNLDLNKVYYSAFNGCKIANASNTKILYEKFMTKEELKIVLDLGKKFECNMSIYVNDAIYIDGCPNDDLHLYKLPFVKRCSYEEGYSFDKAYKIILHSSPDKIDKLKDNYPRELDEMFSICRSSSFFLDFMPKGITKGFSLKKLAEELNINLSDTIAFGDEENDLDMLELAGASVVPSNGRPSIKDLADSVTLSNTNDGVAHYLDEYFYGNNFYNENVIAVSSCLLGNNCKYNGGNNLNQELINDLKDYEILPICPEVFGGLPIPRIPSEIVNDKVINQEGLDVTKEYTDGALKALKLLKKYHCHKAILKEKSPSCGVNNIYDGTFTHTVINDMGITSKLFKENNIKCVSENNYKEILLKENK